ncbi:MAG TPA: PilZ domain-containing protein [Terriglobales bacterium]|nr:PilZ domain-containing protein [Terriglobales bacterium]
MILKRAFRGERRRRARHLLNTSVQVSTGSTHVDALGINISDFGMCLFTIANLRLGSQVQVEFRRPRSAELVRLTGTVRHRALYLYGIEFLPELDSASEGPSQSMEPAAVSRSPLAN